MNTRRLVSRLLLGLFLAWPALGPNLFAQEIENAPTIQPEEENPPIKQPQKKKSRHRVTRTHKEGSLNDRVEIGKDVIVAAGETVGELVVIAGNATVNGTVEGNVVVLSGTARINGQVHEDLVTILGTAYLGPEARIGQDAVVVGGPLKVNPQATIGGQRTEIAVGAMLPDFMWLQKWLTKGLFLARPFPPQVRWVWIAAALMLLFYLALALLFPRPLRACVGALEQQPIASFFIGILLCVLLGPLLFLLVVSVAGLAVIPFLFCALLAAVIFGKVAVYSYAGQQVGRQMHASDLSLPMMLLIGAGLFYLTYMVPVLGFAVWGVATLLGLGAVLLAAFGSFRQETPAYAGAPALMPGPGPAAGTMPMPAVEPGLLPPPPPPAPAIVGTAPADIVLLPHVGFWRRFCATLLDFILLGLIIHLTGPFFLIIWVGYHVAMWAWKGTTIGGIVMSLKIVRLDGQPIDFAVALVRSLSCFFSAFALFLGFFWAGWDKERQAWHDKIAGTIVVKVPKGMSLI
jgi:uncharacterized RDD family membrane protein YckC